MRKLLTLVILIFCFMSFTSAQSVPSSDIKILPTSKVELFQWQSQTKVRLLVNLHNDNDDGTYWHGTVILPYQVQVLDWNNCYEPFFYDDPLPLVAGHIRCGDVLIQVNQTDEFSVVVEPQIGQMKFIIFLWGDAPDPDRSNNYKELNLTISKSDLGRIEF